MKLFHSVSYVHQSYRDPYKDPHTQHWQTHINRSHCRWYLNSVSEPTKSDTTEKSMFGFLRSVGFGRMEISLECYLLTHCDNGRMGCPFFFFLVLAIRLFVWIKGRGMRKRACKLCTVNHVVIRKCAWAKECMASVYQTKYRKKNQ